MGIRTSTCSEALLLEKYVNSSYDIIKKAVDNLDTITLLGDLSNDSESVLFLQSLLGNIDDITNVVNSTELIETVSLDIEKSTFLGHRKLDLDLALNKQGITSTTNPSDALAIWQTTTNTVYYNSAVVTLLDGTIINVPFVNNAGDPTIESTHSGIVSQLEDNAELSAALENTDIFVEIGGIIGSIIRIVDIDGQISNLDRIQLNTNTGAYDEPNPIYYWANTTSSLQVLATRIQEIILVGNNLLAIDNISQYLDEITVLEANLAALLAIYNNLTEILNSSTYAANALAYKNAASSSASVAANYAGLAEASATAAQVAKIEWQGTWSNSVNYEVNDAVRSSGSSYIAIQANLNQVPTVGGNAYWDELAVKGIDGAGGDMFGANNLSEIVSPSTALATLGGEPAITKNTAFNQDFTASGVGDNGTSIEVARGDHVHSQYHSDADFGTSSGTVAEGNHLHTGVYEPEGSSVALAIALG